MLARLKTRAAFKAAAAGVRAIAHIPASAAPSQSDHGSRTASRRPNAVKGRGKSAGTRARVKSQSDQLFSLQAVPARDANSVPRIGFTVTKKVGNAVVRNRIRRRLRAMVSDRADAFRSGTDYVLVARHPALHAPYELLCRSLDRTVAVVHERLEMRETKSIDPVAHQGASDVDRVRKA